MAEQLKNSLDNPTSTLASGITSGATSLTVTGGQGSRFPTTGNFRVKLTVSGDDNQYELCLATARAGDMLTITRGIEGTTSRAFDAGDKVDLVLSTAGFEQWMSENAAALGPATSVRNVIQPTGAAVVPLTVKGAASQSADLQQCQDSAATVRFRVKSNGEVSIYPGGESVALRILDDAQGTNSFLSTRSFGIGIGSSLFNAACSIQGFGADNPAIIVRGDAGQVESLQQWRSNSNTVLAAITAMGALSLLEQADPAAPAANTGLLYVRDNGSGKSQLVVRFPTGVAQVIATEP